MSNFYGSPNNIEKINGTIKQISKVQANSKNSESASGVLSTTQSVASGEIVEKKKIVGSISKVKQLNGNVGEGQNFEGTTNYERLRNKPKINNIELINNKNSKELKLQPEMTVLSNSDINKILGL